MRVSKNLGGGEAVILKPTAAYSQIAHFAVDHGQGSWCVLDEKLENLPAHAQSCLSFPLLGDVLGKQDDAANGAIARTPGQGL